MKRLLLFLFLSFAVNSYADRIYIMNSIGFCTAYPEIISAIEANGHTVVVQNSPFVLPGGFTSRCVDPINGYDWLCFFGNTDFTGLSVGIKNFIDVGGKVFYQYDVDGSYMASYYCSIIASNITGLTITPNAQTYIASSNSNTAGGGWRANGVNCCVNFQGDAYKGMDGIPAANQLLATENVVGSSPAISICPNFGFYLLTDDFIGTSHKGGFVGVGDINVWYNGSGPGGTVQAGLVDFFFPDSSSACFLFPPGCLEDYEIPNGGVSASISVDSPICQGQQLNLNCSFPGGTAFSWTGPNGFVSNLQNPVISDVQAVNDGFYTVTISGTNCSFSITSDSVIVKNAPAGTISSNSPICPGQSLNLMCTGPTGASYYWTGPNGFVSNTQNPVITNAQSINEGVYNLVISKGGCTNSLSVSVIIDGTIYPEILPLSSFCPNDLPVDLTASIGGGSWSGNGITDAVTGTFNPALAGIGITTISYSIVGFCSGSDTEDFVIDELPLMVSHDVETCSGLPVALSASGADTYIWAPSAGLNTTLGSNVIATVGSNSTYIVTGTNTTTGCSNSTSVNVLMDMNFVASAQASPNPVPDGNSTVHFTASPLNAGFSWIFQDGSVSAEQNFDYTFSDMTENQTVILIAAFPNGCIDTVFFKVYLESGEIFYVPNSFTPTNDGVNDIFQPVLTAGFDPKNYELSIFNSWGEMVFETKDVSKGWDGTYLGEMVQDGTYTWTIRFKSSDSDKIYDYEGHVTKIK